MGVAPVVIVTPSLLPGSFFEPAVARRRKAHTGAPRFGQPNGNRLLWRTRAVFAFSNVVEFFAHEFARLCGCGFTNPAVFARPFDGRLTWHTLLSSSAKRATAP